MLTVQNRYLTASGTVKEGGGVLVGVVLTAGTDAATVTLYDNTAASGTVLLKLAAPAGESVIADSLAVRTARGIYAEVAGTSPAVAVQFV